MLDEDIKIFLYLCCFPKSTCQILVKNVLKLVLASNLPPGVFPRNRVARINDHPDMNLAVDC